MFLPWTMSGLVLLLFTSAALAALGPTRPGPNETYRAGSTCIIGWTVDTTGTWKNVTIRLMSGSNTNMTTVATVVGGLDGTNPLLTPYNWTCPQVNPYSDIYFYQFTNGVDQADSAWTTRFTIASPNGQSTPPPNPKQPSGEDVPWGVGHLISSSTSASAAAIESAAQRVGAASAPTPYRGSPGDKSRGRDHERNTRSAETATRRRTKSKSAGGDDPDDSDGPTNSGMVVPTIGLPPQARDVSDIVAYSARFRERTTSHGSIQGSNAGVLSILFFSCILLAI